MSETPTTETTPPETTPAETPETVPFGWATARDSECGDSRSLRLDEDEGVALIGMARRERPLPLLLGTGALDLTAPGSRWAMYVVARWRGVLADGTTAAALADGVIAERDEPFVKFDPPVEV